MGRIVDREYLVSCLNQYYLDQKNNCYYCFKMRCRFCRKVEVFQYQLCLKKFGFGWCRTRDLIKTMLVLDQLCKYFLINLGLENVT